ncbi:MAG: inosine-5-monophosphate dehydrogenase [Flavobacteriales bacterium]|nr:MAG: inosine-5-monophosphate dehydrogenase [Flavobacteriales bacterium]PIE49481.1 MAG: inosine-5-monophosphate dehydrogenase [Flavobacteriales bacterium]
MAVKSFQGPQKGGAKKTFKPTLVKECMTTKLITFKPEQPISEVIEALINNRISGGPVVNDQNELLGIISEGDCIKQVSNSKYHNLPLEDNTVEKCMVKNVDTIDGNLDIFEAAEMFLKAKHRRFPIVESGKLVGQISQKDILIATLAHKSDNW